MAAATEAVALAAYLAVMIGIGWWATRRQRGVGDWLVAGRRLGVWVVALSMVATTASGFAFIGAPGLTYSFGWPPLLWIASSTIGLALTFVLLGKPMRIIMEEYDCLTIPDVLDAIYDDWRVQVLASLVIFVGFLGYMVVQWSSGARAFEGLFPVSYEQGLGIMLAIVAVYTLGGGVLAASYTDFVQMLLMMVAGIAVLGVGFTTVGGPIALNGALTSIDPALTNAVNPAGQPFALGEAIGFFLVFGIGLGGYVISSVRVFFTESVATLRWGGVLAVTGYLVGSIFVWTAGLFYRVLEHRGAVSSISAPDLVFPMFVSQLFPSVLAAIIIAAIIAAIMSTLDSILVLATSAAVHDLYEVTRGVDLSPERSLRYHRIGMVVLAAVTVALSFDPPQFIGLLAASIVGLVVGAFFPPLVVGVRWGRATEYGAIAGLGVGFLVGFGGEVLATVAGVSIPLLSVGGWAVALSSVVTVVVSYLTFDEPLEFWSEVG